MNCTRWFIGSLAVWATLFLYEGVLHAVILTDAYESIRSLLRPEGQDIVRFFLFVGAAELALALGFCYIFVKGYENRGIMEGVRFGAIAGLTFGLFFYLAQYAVFPLPLSLSLSLIVGFVVELIIAGIVIAAIYKPKA